MVAGPKVDKAPIASELSAPWAPKVMAIHPPTRVTSASPTEILTVSCIRVRNDFRTAGDREHYAVVVRSAGQRGRKIAPRSFAANHEIGWGGGGAPPPPPPPPNAGATSALSHAI